MNIPKQITFLNKECSVLNNVITKFVAPIASTLGPNGRSVIITNPDGGLPHVTKDGVTVAESIYFPDQRENAISELIKEAARKTGSSVGDGTTTSVILAGAMIKGGLESEIDNYKEFFDGFDLAFEKAIDILSENNIKITKDSDLLEAVVKISVNHDEKLSKLIMSAVAYAGTDGLVTAELHDDLVSIVDVKGGASLESTAIIPGKVWESEGDAVQLILISGPIKEVREIKQILVEAGALKIPTVIIAKEFSDPVISTVSVNNSRRSVNVALVESEGFTRQHRLDILEDLATIFEVPIFSTDGSTDLSLSKYSEHRGACISENLSKAIVKPHETVLFTVSDETTETVVVSDRYMQLQTDYKDALTAFADDKLTDSGNLKHLQRRMAKYNNVATIKVGGATRAEAVEIKDRVDDALCSVSSAINGGVTEGGGAALVKVAATLDASELTVGKSKSFVCGFDVIVEACMMPFRQLAMNSGIDTAIPKEVFEPGNVYDFKDFAVVHFIEGGIIDPAQVPITALTNASSVARTILKSNSIISEWQEQKAVLS